jgi:hypothetical protein
MIEQAHELGHETLAERRTGLPQRPQISRGDAGERIGDDREADGADDRPFRQRVPLAQNKLAGNHDLADVHHGAFLRRPNRLGPQSSFRMRFA